MCKGADVMKVRNIPLGMLSSKEQGEVKPDDASKKELMYDLAGGMCCERGFDEHLLMGYVDMHNEETKQKGAFAVCMWKEASQEVISKIEDQKASKMEQLKSELLILDDLNAQAQQLLQERSATSDDGLKSILPKL